MWGTCPQSSNPSWRQERKLPCYNAGAGGSPAAPRAHSDRAGCPSPMQTGGAVALLPAREGFLRHFLMNLAEETCSRVITSALYLSWPGWKAMFLQWGLWKKEHVLQILSHCSQEMYIYMTETSSCFADRFRYKKQKFLTVDWYELSSASFRTVSKLLFATDEKHQHWTNSFPWSLRNTATYFSSLFSFHCRAFSYGDFILPWVLV